MILVCTGLCYWEKEHETGAPVGLCFGPVDCDGLWIGCDFSGLHLSPACYADD